MRLSIAIPAHNEEAFILGALRSLEAQEFEGDLEIIICLNACKDKTEEIVRAWAGTSRWHLSVVHEARKGVSWARQRAFCHAGGEIIASADADTYYPPDWAARITESFAQDPNLVQIYGPVRLRDFTGTGRRFWKYAHPIMNDLFTTTGRWLGWHNVIGSNFAVRRSAFLEVGGFDTKLKALEDNEITRRLRRLGTVRYDRALVVYASARRYNRLGFWRTVLFYVRNALKAFLFKHETEDLEDLSEKPEMQ
ncbi:glycosyltransferase [Candidatus Acetothermia bacterium]|jgi:glycosyltransferase involved in cell wall biosynthesis|nr:glycosyltransferase [Candidatus Acetothermia bacterium]MCI2431550.1 glycosyltransferase [Candidatus Acetothermia bacterium]MCI2437155.1 glycosyltransferase [Candidatus Acetothermia bacterium]